MTTTVNIINPIVGPVHMFTESDVANWGDIIDLITTDPCTFEIIYDGVTYAGVVAKSMDGTTLQVAFNDDNIALPSGMCMQVICNIVNPGEDGCYPNPIQDYGQFIRLMAVDENGCPIGYIFVQELITEIRNQLDIPQTLCDLIGDDGIPEGNLVAGDRIVTTTTTGCDLKSVPQGQVVCN